MVNPELDPEGRRAVLERLGIALDRSLTLGLDSETTEGAAPGIGSNRECSTIGFCSASNPLADQPARSLPVPWEIRPTAPGFPGTVGTRFRSTSTLRRLRRWTAPITINDL